MKAFLLLLVFAAVGGAGVWYWRQSLHAPAKPAVTADEHAKKSKPRHRKKRGARRIAHNEAYVASTSPPGEAPTADDNTPIYRPPPEERPAAPLAPGGSATTEAAPADVFGPSGAAPSAPAQGSARRPVVAEPEPVKLRPADLRMVWQGEDLSKAENQRLDFSKDAIGKELSQNEIDARFRAKEDAVLACVARARPDEYTWVPGRVTVKFRIQRSGVVKGVQVEAPVILHRGGITGCIRGVVSNLRFPASDTSQVISYPFSLL
jgi:hypothetical protein